MKKKNNASEVITKGFFRTELKKELKKEIILLESRVALMIDMLKGDIDEANKKYRDELVAMIDPFLKEVLTAREDRTITTHRVTELQEQLEEHEEQILFVPKNPIGHTSKHVP